MDRRVAIVIACLLVLATGIGAQSSGPDTSKASDLPGTVINDKAVSLQTSLYPVLYEDSSAALDMRWVSINDTGLIRFWHQNGDSILSALSELSGIVWTDETLTLYLVRYYPSLGSAEPIIIPLNGIKLGPVTEAISRGAVTNFMLIYQLAQRILSEGAAPSSSTAPVLASHPLMTPSPYFRDNLALLLAYSVSQRILGNDSTAIAYNSPTIKKGTPGRELFERYLRGKWVLMVDKPLTLYVSEEKEDSKLLTSAYSLAANPISQTLPKHVSIEGVPEKGQLGFSVRLNNANQLVVDNIDTTRTAYQCGLRKGDIIRTVAGQRVRTHRELMETILDNLESGASLQVSRNDRTETIYLRSRSKGK